MIISDDNCKASGAPGEAYALMPTHVSLLWLQYTLRLPRLKTLWLVRFRKASALKPRKKQAQAAKPGFRQPSTRPNRCQASAGTERAFCLPKLRGLGTVSDRDQPGCRPWRPQTPAQGEYPSRSPYQRKRVATVDTMCRPGECDIDGLSYSRN